MGMLAVGKKDKIHIIGKLDIPERAKRLLIELARGDFLDLFIILSNMIMISMKSNGFLLQII